MSNQDGLVLAYCEAHTIGKWTTNPPFSLILVDKDSIFIYTVGYDQAI
jgi:hypothetical protein